MQVLREVDTGMPAEEIGDIAGCNDVEQAAGAKQLDPHDYAGQWCVTGSSENREEPHCGKQVKVIN